MTDNISLREFMELVEKRIEGCTRESLRDILLEWAKGSPPGERSEFLEKLNLSPESPASSPCSSASASKDAPDSNALLEEIRALSKKVKDGDYCDGWGWDDEIHDERDWGDESWAPEVDDFFSSAHKAMLAGDYALARDAYALLFKIIDMGGEPGHLPGAPDPLDMLDTDIREARACYLRSVYFSSKPHERVQRLWNIMKSDYSYQASELNMKCMIDAGTKEQELPEFKSFLEGWISMLKGKKGHYESYLLREAVTLAGGIDAIAKLAREGGKRHPRAYVDWICALEKKMDYVSMLNAAKEGLGAVPKDYVVRSEIADGMVRAGIHLGDADVQLAGWREAFYSEPILSRLLPLVEIAAARGRYREEIAEAIGRIACLTGKKEGAYSFDAADLRKSSASESLLAHAYILAGRYGDAFNMCSKNDKSLGWSSGSNPKSFLVPFFLHILLKQNSAFPAKNLDIVWEAALDCSAGHWDFFDEKRTDAAQLKNAVDKARCLSTLTEEEEAKYLRWCTDEIGLRVDAIVSGKHRQSYFKAADMLAALAEVLAGRGTREDGARLIEEYYRKYNHHAAFRKELCASAKRSGMSP